MSLSLLENGYMASLSSDFTVKIWDIINNKLKFTLEDGRYTTRMASLQDGYMATSSSDNVRYDGMGLVRIWDITSGRLKFTFNASNGGYDRVESMISLGNGYLATGTNYGNLMIWDIENGQLRHIINRYNGTSSDSIYMLSLIGQDYFASFYSNFFLEKCVFDIWDLNNYQFKYRFSSCSVTKLVSIDEKYFATGDNGGLVIIWNMQSGENEKFNEHNRIRIVDMILLDNNLLASGSYDGKIVVWDINAKRMKYAFDNSNDGHTRTVNALVSLGNNYMASGSADSTIKIWKIKDKGELKYTIDKSNCGHNKDVKSLLILENGNLASSSSDKSIKIWELKNLN